LKNLTSLFHDQEDMADEKKIKNLEGLQYCTSLKQLYLAYNQISDIIPNLYCNNLISML